MQAPPDAPEIEVAILGSGDMKGLLRFPQPFVEKENFYLVIPLNEGILFPANDKTVRPLTLVGWRLCASAFDRIFFLNAKTQGTEARFDSGPCESHAENSTGAAEN